MTQLLHYYNAVSFYMHYFWDIMNVIGLIHQSIILIRDVRKKRWRLVGMSGVFIGLITISFFIYGFWGGVWLTLAFGIANVINYMLRKPLHPKDPLWVVWVRRLLRIIEREDVVRYLMERYEHDNDKA